MGVTVDRKTIRAFVILATIYTVLLISTVLIVAWLDVGRDRSHIANLGAILAAIGGFVLIGILLLPRLIDLPLTPQLANSTLTNKQIKAQVMMASLFPGNVVGAILLFLLGNGEESTSMMLITCAAVTGPASMLFEHLRTHRKRDEIFCKNCGYQKAEGAGKLCPECGRNWEAAANVVKGRLTNQKWLYGVIVAVFVVCIFSYGMPLFGRFFCRYIPDSVIVHVTKQSDHPSYRLMDEVENRNFSPKHTTELLDHFLDQRLEYRAFSDYRAERFVKSHIDDPMVSPHILDRYNAEMFALRINAPDEVQKWYNIKVSLGVLPRSSVTKESYYLCLGGHQVDGGPVPYNGVRSKNWVTMKTGTVYRNIWTPDTAKFAEIPGTGIRLRMSGEPIEINTTVWLAIFPKPLTSHSIKWNQDGTPVFPPNVLWHGHVDLEKIIKIGPD